MSADGRFVLGMMRQNSDLRAWYSSEHGDLTDCPVPMRGEGWCVGGTCVSSGG